MKSIKKYRGLANLSQTELATQVGVTKSYIAYLEKDTTDTICYDLACSIAKVLNCSIIQIYGIDNIKVKPKTKDETILLIDIILNKMEYNQEEKIEIVKEINNRLKEKENGIYNKD